MYFDMIKGLLCITALLYKEFFCLHYGDWKICKIYPT